MATHRQRPNPAFPFGRILAESAGARPGLRLLDLAAGEGAVALPAVAAGAEVVAVDLAPAALRALRAASDVSRTDAGGRDRAGAAPGAARPVLADLHRLPFPAAAFPAATCGFALQLMDRPDRVLSEVRRVLRPGGLFAWSTPGWGAGGDRWSFVGRAIAAQRHRLDPSLVARSSHAALLEAAEAAGFRTVDSSVHQASAVLPGGAAAFLEWFRSCGPGLVLRALPPGPAAETAEALRAGAAALEESDGSLRVDRLARIELMTPRGPFPARNRARLG